MNLKKTTAVLTKVTKTSGKETFELTLGKDTVDLNKTTDSKDKALYNFTDVKKDYSDLKYQMVTVLYKNNDKSKVYGVYVYQGQHPADRHPEGHQDGWRQEG